MKYIDVALVLRSDEKDLANNVFEKDGFSFTENIIIDQLNNYDERDVDELIEDARKFGCIIKGNNIVLPAGLRVKITTSHNPHLCYIERNGVEFPFSYIDSNDEINVTFTEFGQKLYTYAQSAHTTLNYAYDLLKAIEQIFGVKIINK